MVLARNQRWAFPHVSGIITTPTLRCDGSLNRWIGPHLGRSDVAKLTKR
jgi:hypothetical protein